MAQLNLCWKLLKFGCTLEFLYMGMLREVEAMRVMEVIWDCAMLKRSKLRTNNSIIFN